MSKNDGGPAFPREDYQTDDAPGQRGMTLRDYFAAKAMQGILCQRQPHTHTSYAERETCIREACEVAFVYADCLLAARAKERT